MEFEPISEENSKFTNRCQTDEQKSAVLTIEKIWNEYNQGNISPNERIELLDEYLNGLSPEVQEFLFHENDYLCKTPMSLIMEIANTYRPIYKTRR